MLDKRTTRAVAIIVTLAAVAATGATLGLVWLSGGLADTRGNAAREPLPVLAQAPPFELIDQHGQTVSHDALRGKIWIADFIFTRCAGACPMMTAGLARVRDQLRETRAWSDVRLVSFSVDPNHDTPTALRTFADRYDANSGHWLFLTGADRATMWSLSRDGFMLSVFENADDPVMPIGHSGKFVLVDRAGRIRGYYDSRNPAERAALARDAVRLVDEQ